MIEVMLDVYILIVASFLLGGIIFWLGGRLLGTLKVGFRAQAPIIQKYWKFVVPFVLVNIIAYVIVWLFFYSEINFNILGQVSTLAFAVFVGFIAFSELNDRRAEKLKSEAMSSFSKYEFKTAVRQLEEAHKADPSDRSILANLLECYLIMGNYSTFDKKIGHHEELIVEYHHRIAHHYLTTLRQLIVEHLQEGKDVIQEAIAFVKEHPEARSKFVWRLSELKASETYKHLSIFTKRVIDNFYRYLKAELDPEAEKAFEDGEYELTDYAAKYGAV